MVTTPTAFVVIMAGVGVNPSSDFNDEHAEVKRHTEAVNVATASRGERNSFIFYFYLKGWPMSNCLPAWTRSREASEPDVSAPRVWFLIGDGICTGAVNFQHQTPLRRSSGAGSSL
jgi:hypothetical protein